MTEMLFWKSIICGHIIEMCVWQSIILDMHIYGLFDSYGRASVIEPMTGSNRQGF